jgi:uncharacterized repeat protein (TIGR04076 family)
MTEGDMFTFAEMNYPEASCEMAAKTTHPFVPSLSREGKPEGRGELKPKHAPANRTHNG